MQCEGGRMNFAGSTALTQVLQTFQKAHFDNQPRLQPSWLSSSTEVSPQFSHHKTESIQETNAVEKNDFKDGYKVNIVENGGVKSNKGSMNESKLVQRDVVNEELSEVDEDKLSDVEKALLEEEISDVMSAISEEDQFFAERVCNEDVPDSREEKIPHWSNCFVPSQDNVIDLLSDDESEDEKIDVVRERSVSSSEQRDHCKGVSKRSSNYDAEDLLEWNESVEVNHRRKRKRVVEPLPLSSDSEENNTPLSVVAHHLKRKKLPKKSSLSTKVDKLQRKHNANSSKKMRLNVETAKVKPLPLSSDSEDDNTPLSVVAHHLKRKEPSKESSMTTKVDKAPREDNTNSPKKMKLNVETAKKPDRLMKRKIEIVDMTLQENKGIDIAKEGFKKKEKKNIRKDNETKPDKAKGGRSEMSVPPHATLSSFVDDDCKTLPNKKKNIIKPKLTKRRAQPPSKLPINLADVATRLAWSAWQGRCITAENGSVSISSRSDEIYWCCNYQHTWCASINRMMNQSFCPVCDQQLRKNFRRSAESMNVDASKEDLKSKQERLFEEAKRKMRREKSNFSSSSNTLPFHAASRGAKRKTKKMIALQVFDLPPTASAKEIRSRYRKLVLRYHPDKNRAKGAEEMFKRIAAAYKILK
eukprot:g6145.t1